MKKEKQLSEEHIESFETAISTMPLDSKNFIDNSMGISHYVYTVIESINMSQKQLADKLEKNESELSKWLSGMHNLTLRSISKIETVLDIDIINPILKAPFRMKAEEEKYVERYGYALGNYVSSVEKASVTVAGLSEFGFKTDAKAA